jgi:hypothetical protein
MEDFLIFLRILQVRDNDERHEQGLERLGKGYSTAVRINSYNPLSYLFLILVLFIGIIMFGFVGVWKEINHNPFKWD